MIEQINKVERIVENECLLLGLQYDSISEGKAAAGKLYAMAGCFTSAIQAGSKQELRNTKAGCFLNSISTQHSRFHKLKF